MGGMKALLLALACAVPGSAHPAASSAAQDSPEARQLRAWIADLHRSNEVFMQLGRLASRRGASGPVRRFGDRVERDHRDGDHRLFKLARRRGVAVEEQQPDAEEQLAIQRLRALNGPDFDRLFADVMASEQKRQERTLGAAQAASDVKRLASQLLPVARQNEELARYLQRKGS